MNHHKKHSIEQLYEMDFDSLYEILGDELTVKGTQIFPANKKQLLTKGHFGDLGAFQSNSGIKFDKVIAHNNELEADIGSMELNLESFPNIEMTEWGIYKEALIAPFLVLAVFYQLEKLSDPAYASNDSTHPSSKTRIKNLVQYYKTHIKPWKEIFEKASLVLTRYGVDSNVVKYVQ